MMGRKAVKKKEKALYQLVFWFDIVTFALMAASFVFAYNFYSRTRLRWLRDYLVYLVCYAAWLLFSTYFFFQAIYLPYPLGQLSLVAIVFRVLVSLIILYAGPMFALRIADLRVERRERWLLSIPVAFVFGTVLVFYSTGSARVAIVPNGVFNLYLGALFLVAALRATSTTRGARQVNSLRRAFLPFVWFSVGAYAVLLAANIVDVAVPGLISSPILDVGLAGAYCFVWSIITIVILLTRLGVIAPPAAGLSRAVELSGDFIEAYGLTEREREIAEDLMTGAQSKEIADKRFISPRTVDTHIYNIYRKCSIKNRVELMRLADHYRP